VTEPSGREAQQARLIHRELQQLALLIAVAVVAFFATRALAEQTRDMRRADAAIWFTRGEQALHAGRVADALRMYRRAAVRDPTSTFYRLGLARALAADHREAAAVEALLALREVEPESPDVNTELARLTARAGDQQAAVRYYQSALSALWRPTDRERRRTLRLEMIRFLIAHGQALRAVPDILTLSTNLPPDAAWYTRVGLLLLEVDEPERALTLFRDALAFDPSDADARAGASRARALIAIKDRPEH
jgi:tetratricopeptide (TPR) repeat protein